MNRRSSQPRGPGRAKLGSFVKGIAGSEGILPWLGNCLVVGAENRGHEEGSFVFVTSPISPHTLANAINIIVRIYANLISHKNTSCFVYLDFFNR